MNYLALVQALWRESGAGAHKPSTVEDQAGESERLVYWIRQADEFVQELHADWNFLWGQETFTTTSGQSVYTPGVSVSLFDRDAWFVEGEPAPCIEYIDIKDQVRDDTSGQPYQVVLLPDGTIRLDGDPDDAYSVQYDYWAPVQTMQISSTAESVIPVEYRQVIVGKALMLYAEYENAPEILQKGATMYQHWLMRLESKQLPGKRYYHTKAEGNEWRVEVE